MRRVFSHAPQRGRFTSLALAGAVFCTVTSVSAVASAQTAPSTAGSASRGTGGTGGSSGGSSGSGSGGSTDVRAAGEAFDNGTARYLRREFGAAANWFETADRLAPSPQALRAAIQAHDQAATPDHQARAATLALRLLSRYPDNSQAELTANRVLQRLAPQFARLNIRCGSCEVEFDQALQASTEFFVPPGRHTLVAHWSENRVVERSIEATAGTVETITFTEPPRTRRDGPPNCTQNPDAPECVRQRDCEEHPEECEEERPRQGVRVLHPGVFIGAAAATALLGTGVALSWFLDAQPAANRLIMNAMTSSTPNRMLEDAVHGAENRTTALWVATGVVGAGTALVGIIFTRWSGPPRSAPRASVGPNLNGSLGLTINGRF